MAWAARIVLSSIFITREQGYIGSTHMCGRMTATFEFSDILVRWNLDGDLPKYTPRFNIAPGQVSPTIPVIVRHKGGNEGSQSKPTAPLALSSTERLHKKPFACLPTALRPSGPGQQWIFHQAEQELTTLPVLRYSSGP